jgi:16S rRNA (adenine1518-N6/adenine1519-N6)-dimethyltransferase
MISQKITPNKSFGQNFLTDKNFLTKIVSAGDLKPEDTVLEIGAGTGVLTVELAKRVKRVIAYEIDKKLIRVLQENLAEYKNVEIVNADILDTRHQIPDTKYKLIANIPYNITSKILEKFLSARPQRCTCASGRAQNKPSLIVLLVQKEVAERICACPQRQQAGLHGGRVKSGHQSVLSVSVQFYGQPSIVAKVPASAFWPAPRVDSAILKIVVNQCHSGLDPESRCVDSRLRGNDNTEQNFFHLVKAGFANKRKMLKNNLKEYGEERVKTALIELGLDEKIRAEDLNVEQWIKLLKKL